MQKDSDRMHNQAATQDHVSQSFQCSHCILRFKTKVFLFEHLNNVHGYRFEEDARSAGLTNNANSDASESTPDGSHPGSFETGRLEVLNDREHNREENGNNLDEEVFKIQELISANQETDGEEADDLATSKKKDLRTYEKPLQTSITNYLVVGPQPNETPTEKSSDVYCEHNDDKGSSSSESSNSSSDTKADAPAGSLDIANKMTFLQYDHLYEADLTPPIDQVKEAKANKKTNESEEKTLAVPDKETKPEPLDRKELSFEVSEDDEDKRTAEPRSYLCKHCSHKDESLKRMHAHYHKAHPYIRYRSKYIQDASDRSATFRCLVCPVDFSSEADLRKHHSDEHTGAPDIFSLQRHQLGLLFKCFRCAFTSGSLDVLKEHYKERHPAHKALKSLMFLKYLPTQSQESPPELKEPDPTPSLAKPPQTRPEIEPNVATYRCHVCHFSHTSVIVMHVHYQKYHPEEEVTFGRIKRLACVTPQPAKKTPGDQYSARETDKVKRKSSHLLIQPPEAHSEAPPTKKVKSSEDRSEGSDSPPELGTQPTEHTQKAVEGTLKQNAKAKLQKLVAKVSKRTTSKASKQMKSSGEELKQNDSDKPATSLSQLNSYANAQDLFYCYKCNYGNPTVKGVKAHQVQIHQNIQASNESIVAYTSKIHDQLEKSRAQARDPSFSPSLPLPLLKKGEENMFFCHFCNYRRGAMCEVIHHYIRRHPGYEATTEEIQLYTSTLLQKLQIPPPKAAEVGEAGEEAVEEPPNKTANIKIFKASQKLKTLQCHDCIYKTHSASLFRIHIQKCHRVNNSSSGVLKVYLKQENVQSGYRCDLCSFAHKKSTMLYKHYRQEHPESRSGLDFITTSSQDGHKTSSVKKKSRIKRELDCGGETDGCLQNETRTYSCRACSFKGTSVASIKDHYRAVHPWCVKDDGSVPSDGGRKKSNGSKGEEDRKEFVDSFDDYQIPLEYEKSPRATPEADASPPSPCGSDAPRATRETKPATAIAAKQQEHTRKRVHVFKCTYCSYVNTKRQGVLTHCQMRHTDLKSRAESLHVDEKHVRDWGDCMKRKGHWDMHRPFRGHMCKLCPRIHATVENLKKHYERDHDEAPPPDVEADIGKAKQKKIPNNSISSYKNKITLFRCQQCAFTCSTKIAFGRHMRFKHKNAALQDCKYNCVLCSNSYFKKKRLGIHYTAKHGKDAFQKYFIPLHEHGPELAPQTSADSPQPPDTDDKSGTVSKLKKQVFRCPCCPYVNSRHHGMSIHWQMLHADFAVKVEEFVKDEIFIKSTYQSGTNNKRGYLCSVCLGIYVSKKKLSIHCAKKHSPAVTENDKPASKDQDSLGPPSVDPAQSGRDAQSDAHGKKAANHNRAYPCSLCPYSSQIRKRLAGHYTKEHGKAAFLKHFAQQYLYQKLKKAQPASPEDVVTQEQEVEAPHSNASEPDGTVYRCRICDYKTGARRYLTYHYKKTHQLDAVTRYKLLKEYNKRKRSPPPQMLEELESSDDQTPKDLEGRSDNECKTENFQEHPGSECKTEDLEERSDNKCQAEILEERSDNKCKKCRNLVFESPQLLLGHYDSVHRANRRLDFTILYPLGRSTGVYRCNRCLKRMNGIRKLWHHLDLHRGKMWMKARKKKARAFSAKPSLAKPDDPQVSDTAEKVSEGNAVREEHSLASPSKPGEEEQQEPASGSETHGCAHCQRTFKSLNGLRTHERSHATLAALKKLPSTQSQLSLNKYLLHKPGTLRPFQCKICFYRTNLIGLWNNHLLKKHLDIIIQTSETDDQEETRSTESNRPPLCHDQAAKHNEGRTKDWYLEPPEVRRQLSHLSLMAQNAALAEANMQVSRLTDSGPFHCEYCGFISEGLPGLRRHYMSRHGRKLFRCKDCDFFTGLRKTLKMHMEADHSTFLKEPPPHDGVRCPFCLYQTKNKNNMIDHVLLHREERVVPMEVRRPKLSRYLHGVVFRCHKCTYSSASAENLHSHVAKHDDVKPYRCRLCYFDCVKLSALEAHLCSKHHVVRNHELVGQVNLDQLEMKINRKTSEDEEMEEERSNVEHQNMETEDVFTDLKEETQEREGSKFMEKKMQQQKGRNTEELGSNSDPQSEHRGSLRTTEQQEEEVGKEDVVAEGSSKKRRKLKLKSLKDKTLDIEAQVENDILRHILQLDEDSDLHRPHRKGVQGRSIGVRQILFQDDEAGWDIKREMDRESSSLKEGVSLESSKDEAASKRRFDDCYGHTATSHERCLKEERSPITLKDGEGHEEEQETKHVKLEEHQEDEQAGKTPRLKSALEAGDAAVPKDKTFPCELCGRNLKSESELERHASRHGM